MEPKVTPSKVDEQGESKLIVANNQLKNVKSHYIIKKFFGYISKRKYLEAIRYNKSIQKRIDININHYKAYSEEYSVPVKGKNGKFIDIEKEDKKYFHIYFNDNKKQEIENTSLYKDDIVSKITIIIDYQIKSFSRLFYACWIIESIKFKKFYRNNVNDMSRMFYKCSSLKELNLNNFNADNVTDMRSMFERCTSLKELNLSYFNTNNVTNMSCMLSKCSLLKELNLSNFNTNNVKDMSCMLYGCSDELKNKIKEQIKNKFMDIIK